MFRFTQRLRIFMMCIFFSVSFFSSGWYFSSWVAESGGRAEFSCRSPWLDGGSRGRARSELQTQVVRSYDRRKPSKMLAKCPTKLETRVEHLLCELPGGEVGGTAHSAAPPHRSASRCPAVHHTFTRHQPQKLSSSQTLKYFYIFLLSLPHY